MTVLIFRHGSTLVDIYRNKKLGRWGKDRPHGIALKREYLSTPTEKTPEPPPHPYTGRRFIAITHDSFIWTVIVYKFKIIILQSKTI